MRKRIRRILAVSTICILTLSVSGQDNEWSEVAPVYDNVHK
jgi:hypothetical protein